MKIAWFCIPAYGHTNPTLGLVRELTSAGHQVYYFSFEMFRDRIEQAGATFIGCDGYDFDMEDKETRTVSARTRSSRRSSSYPRPWHWMQ